MGRHAALSFCLYICDISLQPRHQIGPIEGDFAVALSLYHGYDLLMQHGLLPFYNFIKGQ